MITIVHDDDEDGAYGMCLAIEADWVESFWGGAIHSVWQCARPDCRRHGDGEGFMHVERCSRYSPWRRLLLRLRLVRPRPAEWLCIEAADAQAHAEVHGDHAMNVLEQHWKSVHPDASWGHRSHRH